MFFTYRMKIIVFLFGGLVYYLISWPLLVLFFCLRNDMTISEHDKILTWLFVNDGAYPDKTKWRRALLEMLEFMVDEWHPKDITPEKEEGTSLSPPRCGGVMVKCEKSHSDWCNGCFKICPDCCLYVP